MPKLCFPVVVDSVKKGRPRRYGPPAPTPEQILRDDSVPWIPVEAFAAGKLQTFKIKVVENLFWRKAGCDRPLRLLVIKPLGYRLRNGAPSCSIANPLS